MNSNCSGACTYCKATGVAHLVGLVKMASRIMQENLMCSCVPKLENFHRYVYLHRLVVVILVQNPWWVGGGFQLSFNLFEIKYIP